MKAESSASPTDTRIVCPLCGYNQTGAASPQCPECGVSWEDAVRRAERRLWIRLLADTAFTFLVLPTAIIGVIGLLERRYSSSAAESMAKVGLAMHAINSLRFGFTVLIGTTRWYGVLTLGLILSIAIFGGGVVAGTMIGIVLGLARFSP